MITPKDVLDRHRNVQPFERQIDDSLRSPWTEEMKQKGRKVSLRIPRSAAEYSGVLDFPSPEQLDTLTRVYQSAGWSFNPDPKQFDVWVFEYPKGKTP
jgi:hypothetical protein